MLSLKLLRSMFTEICFISNFEINCNEIVSFIPEAATQYVVSLRAFNNFGKGPVVYDLIYTREIDGNGASILFAINLLNKRISICNLTLSVSQKKKTSPSRKWTLRASCSGSPTADTNKGMQKNQAEFLVQTMETPSCFMIQADSGSVWRWNGVDLTEKGTRPVCRPEALNECLRVGLLTEICQCHFCMLSEAEEI